MRKPIRTTGARLGMLSVVCVVLVFGAAASSAVALPTNCSQSGLTVTCTFTATGTTQTFTPPAGVSSIMVSLTGASGGAGGTYNFTGGSGGLGASVSGSVAVVGGQPLTVYVARAGHDGSYTANTGIGGFGLGNGGNGGARGDSVYASGGGGGGASAVVAGTTPLAVAGGGGGGGGGGSIIGPAGSGGASGVGGQTTPDGQDGTYARGLSGGGGGGGGGVNGGKGGNNGNYEGASGSGGSGGTDLVPAGGTVTNGANTGDGLVTISYSVAPTSKDQCRKNGWQNFDGAFKNQGDCVSYVATGGKNQPANG